MAGQGPKARELAKEIADGLISLGGPTEGCETCLVSTGGTVLDDGEDVTSPRASFGNGKRHDGSQGARGSTRASLGWNETG